MMKKVLLLAAFGVAVLISAKNSITGGNSIYNPIESISENPVEKLINNKEFVTFAKTHGLNQEVLMQTQYKVTQFEALNSEVYEYDLSDDESLIIVNDKRNSTTQYFYSTVQANVRVIIDRYSTNILVAENDLKCVTDTVDFMKKSCDENITCKVTCDLSPNCTIYICTLLQRHIALRAILLQR